MLFLAATAGSSRPTRLQEFYGELDRLHGRTDGPYYLSDVDGSLDWPERGVYVFFDPNTDLKHQQRDQWYISRIGTVGVSQGSTSTLWDRLLAHRGTTSGAYEDGGNHRGSIFRQHVGRSIIESEGLQDEYPHWGTAHRSLPDDLETTALREQEHPLELRVSEYVRDIPFLVIDIPGGPGPDCSRAMIEKNLIALTAHARRTTPGLIRDGWIGRESPRGTIAHSGLWNLDHVNAFYSDSIITDVEPYIDQTDPIGVSNE